MNNLGAKFKEFLESVSRVEAKQREQFCNVCRKNYYDKLTYKEALETLFYTEKEELEKWAINRAKSDIYILVSYCGIGTAFYAVDYYKNEWEDISDYSSW